ncbi:hypothetical protein KFL_006760040 [Klebsormidium nitens]|uniref:Uncharacterized protein n=1 Tax=Klebsormidium nitens TaxID=105231 RepID=A0A1Y1IIK2_KLENI|nr:hypothetical protein KFL_006760040 [Klebsormidium nitens]|eukprot:GAQ90705.1 hypothetical protein KFL_006760040 [Klebsormidium nitens]
MHCSGLPFETVSSVAKWAADVRKAAETDRKFTQFLPLIPLLEGIPERQFPSFATERTRHELEMAGARLPTLLGADKVKLLLRAVA